MQGVRRDWATTKAWDLNAGEYMYRLKDDGTIGVWVRLPDDANKNRGPLPLSGWSPVIHEDGTLTLSPSILVHSHDTIDRETNERVTIPEWHGYLERGVWREC